MTDVDCCKSTYRNYTSEMFWKLWKMKCSGNHCSFCVDWNSWTWIQCQFNAEWSQTKWQIPDDQSNVTQNWEAKIAVIGFASVLLCRQHHCASNSCRYNHQRPHKQKKPHAKLLGTFSPLLISAASTCMCIASIEDGGRPASSCISVSLHVRTHGVPN